jgi:anti-sigma B factor antagonist
MISLLKSPRAGKSARNDGTVVRIVDGKVFVDEETTHRIHDQLLALAEEPDTQSLVLDFSNVDFLTSAALGTLVQLHKKLAEAGRQLKIRNLRPQIYEVFTVTRLDLLLDLKLQGAEVPLEG